MKMIVLHGCLIALFSASSNSHLSTFEHCTFSPLFPAELFLIHRESIAPLHHRSQHRMGCPSGLDSGAGALERCPGASPYHRGPSDCHPQCGAGLLCHVRGGVGRRCQMPILNEMRTEFERCMLSPRRSSSPSQLAFWSLPARSPFANHRGGGRGHTAGPGYGGQPESRVSLGLSLR